MTEERVQQVDAEAVTSEGASEPALAHRPLKKGPDRDERQHRKGQRERVLRKRQLACQLGVEGEGHEVRGEREGARADHLGVELKIGAGVVARQVVDHGRARAQERIELRSRHEVDRGRHAQQRIAHERDYRKVSLRGDPDVGREDRRYQVEPDERVDVPEVPPREPLEQVQEGRLEGQQPVEAEARDQFHDAEGKAYGQKDEGHSPDVAPDLLERHLPARVEQERTRHHEEHRDGPARQGHAEDVLRQEERGIPLMKLGHEPGGHDRMETYDGEGTQYPRPLVALYCLALGHRAYFRPPCSATKESTSSHVGIAAWEPTLPTQSAAQAEA